MTDTQTQTHTLLPEDRRINDTTGLNKPDVWLETVKSQFTLNTAQTETEETSVHLRPRLIRTDQA